MVRAVGTHQTPLGEKQPGTGGESPRKGAGRAWGHGCQQPPDPRWPWTCRWDERDGGGCDGQPVCEPPSHSEEGSYRQGLKGTSRLSPGFSSWRSKYKPQLGQAKVAGKVCGVTSQCLLSRRRLSPQSPCPLWGSREGPPWGEGEEVGPLCHAETAVMGGDMEVGGRHFPIRTRGPRGAHAQPTVLGCRGGRVSPMWGSELGSPMGSGETGSARVGFGSFFGC